ncbi:hypothetical protein CBL_00710 [Carabus blaptoides fortunei]
MLLFLFLFVSSMRCPSEERVSLASTPQEHGYTFASSRNVAPTLQKNVIPLQPTTEIAVRMYIQPSKMEAEVGDLVSAVTQGNAHARVSPWIPQGEWAWSLAHLDVTVTTAHFSTPPLFWALYLSI